MDRRPDELCRDRPASRRRPRRGHRRGRGGHGPQAHLRRALRSGRELRRRAAFPWGEAWRPRRGLPSVDPGVRRGGPRDRRDRRCLHPDLLGIRRGGHRRPAARCRGDGPHLRRWLLSTRAGREDEGGRGRGGGRRTIRRHRGRRRSRGPVVSQARPRRFLVGRHAFRGGARHRRHLRRGPIHGHLHLGHDRQTEGRATRARRVSNKSRAGSRALLRPSGARRDPLVDGYRLDDGSVAHRGRAHARRDNRPVRRDPGFPRRVADVVPCRAAPRDASRHLPDRDPWPDAIG